MEENIISNPFVGCTARDMKYDDVRKYWCSPFEVYKLSENELLTSRTPIVIEGARGTGKTMILKYLSYSVQKEFMENMTFEEKLAYLNKRSVGIYFRYKADFCNMFDELDCNWQDKERIFKCYYELSIIRQIIEMLSDFYQGYDSEKIEEVVSSFFGVSKRTLIDVRDHINICLKQIDRIINISTRDASWRDKLMPLLEADNMIIEFIQMINNVCQGWQDMLFVILLDEYENLGMFQPIVNTLIKQVDDTANLTYRLGMRPAGMDNNNTTNVAGECLQVDRDFLLRRLEYKTISEYKQFALEISKKRLENVDVYKINNLCDINTILGKNEDFDAEANSVAKGVKQFKLLKKYFTKDEMDDVIKELSCDEKLMEMYNILRVYRGENYKKIGELCRKYQTLREKRQLKTAEDDLYKYHLDYSNKYRVALLYILLVIYGEKKMYYSVNTFLRLSSGSINDFISLCRNVFKHMNYEMLEELKQGSHISSQIQTYASIDTAEDQRRKVAMSNRFGSQMYTFIDNMGSIFEEYHRDFEVKYPETNQFAFANENEIRNNKELNAYLVELINSGAIIRKQKRQLLSVGRIRGALYQLNRIYAPIYQYSYRTRGGYNQIIGAVDFKTMLDRTVDPKLYVNNNAEYLQICLFDSVEEDVDESTDL